MRYKVDQTAQQGRFILTGSAAPNHLGANQIDAAAQNLLEIKKQIAQDPKGKPPVVLCVLCVLCGLANAASQRPGGVFVAPLTALKE